MAQFEKNYDGKDSNQRIYFFFLVKNPFTRFDEREK